MTPQTWVPLAYGLLPDKNLDSYNKFFSSVKCGIGAMGEDIAARYVMADFEINLRKSIQENFKHVELKGCHFHYSKAQWTQIT